MIVLDASAVVEVLTNGALADSVRAFLSLHDEDLALPELLEVEALHALRNLVSGRRLEAHRMEQVLLRLSRLPAQRYSHTPLIPRIWELRHNFTAYDATYIALAEALDATLCTCDAKLRLGHRARVVVLEA